MKKPLLILLICLPFISFSQSKWLKKTQECTYKIDGYVDNKEVTYITKDTLIIDCNKFIITDGMYFLFMMFDNKNDSLYSYSYSDFNSDSCFITTDLSKNRIINVDLINEYKIIAGYKCQKAIAKDTLKLDNIIWFTTDPALKDFFVNKDFNIKGVILENNNKNVFITTTKVSILTETPVVINVIKSIKRCDLTIPTDIKPIIDNEIREIKNGLEKNK